VILTGNKINGNTIARSSKIVTTVIKLRWRLQQ